MMPGVFSRIEAKFNRRGDIHSVCTYHSNIKIGPYSNLLPTVTLLDYKISTVN